MDIRQLEYFVEVAKQRSFTKAAAILHVSQPSISKAIQNVEAELGVPLFYRSSKQLALTDAGEAVLINALQVLTSFKNMRSELTDLMELKKGRIRIGIPPIVGAEFFSKLISEYKEAFPYIEISLDEVGTKRIRQHIEAGELDVGLVCSIHSTHEHLRVIPFLKDPLQLIVHEHHPLAQQSSITMAQLKDETFIMYRKDFILYDRIVEECSKSGFFPTIACETTQKDLLIELVHAKVGIALLPAKIAAKIPYAEIKRISFEQQPVQLELGITWKNNKYLPFAVREFIRMSEAYMLK